MQKRKPNRKPYPVIKSGDPVIIFEYMVVLCPDAETKFEPMRVTLRWPEADGKKIDPFSQEMRREAFDRAVTLHRKAHQSTKNRQFLSGGVEFFRSHCELAR